MLLLPLILLPAFAAADLLLLTTVLLLLLLTLILLLLLLLLLLPLYPILPPDATWVMFGIPTSIRVCFERHCAGWRHTQHHCCHDDRTRPGHRAPANQNNGTTPSVNALRSFGAWSCGTAAHTRTHARARAHTHTHTHTRPPSPDSRVVEIRKASCRCHVLGCSGGASGTDLAIA